MMDRWIFGTFRRVIFILPQTSNIIMNKKPSDRIPQEMRSTYDSIVGMTDDFCRAHLNQEYADLCRKMAAALCRKRPSPLASGATEIWASSVLYAVGKVNFLFDKTQTPHLRADELCSLLGVSANTVSAKAKRIMDILKIGLMDPKWCLPSKLADNPLAWMISVNGFMIDARHAPREIQEEARRRGLIPYIP
jgi:hypothetical protein